VSRFIFLQAPRAVAGDLARLRADLAALQMRWARVKLALKYSPDQPRVPAGSSDGGQWTEWVRVAANDRGAGGGATDAQIRSPKQDGTHVVLPNGKMVANKYSETGYLVSPVTDLSPVAAAGREAGTLYRQMLASPDPDLQQAALPFFIGSIGGAISQGGTFDYQRSGNYVTGFIEFPQFRDVSNFNVGLYMQQTGQFSEEDTLSLAGTFARYFSSNYMPNQPYGLDPRTASFIRAGYRMAAGGAFGKAAKQ
jgi:hypothetical protein